MITEPQIKVMSNEEFRVMAWSALTNRKECGGGSKAAKRAARQRLRESGGLIFMSLHSEGDEYWTQWGIAWGPSELPCGPDLVEVKTGASLKECAHKLGDGDANKGYDLFFNW